MRKEGLTTQDRGAGTDTGVVFAKDIGRGIEEDAFFVTGELLADADPFHDDSLAGRIFLPKSENGNSVLKDIEQR